MDKLRGWLYKALLPELLRRRCPDRIPRSGEAGEKTNCFSVFIAADGKKNFLAERLEGTRLHGKRWGGDSFSIDESVELSSIDPDNFWVYHYYGLTDIRFRGLTAVAKGRLLGFIYAKIHIQRVWDAISQYFFNKRKLVTKERIRLLRILIEGHIEHPDRALSVIDVMTDVHSLRWVIHPDAESAQRKLELYLESLCASGELSKQGHRYKVTGQAVATIDKFEEEERRHGENMAIQRRIIWLTIAIVLLTAVQAEIIKLPTLVDWSNKKIGQGLPNPSLDRPAAR